MNQPSLPPEPDGPMVGFVVPEGLDHLTLDQLDDKIAELLAEGIYRYLTLKGIKPKVEG